MLLVVAGLRRSGTSMLMRMLAAGGMPVLCDNCETPDVDNPNGYYEFGPSYPTVNGFDWSWMRAPANAGHAVKLNERIFHAPPDAPITASIIIRRDLAEAVSSYATLRHNRGFGTTDTAAYATFAAAQVANITRWASSRVHLDVDFGQLILDPAGQSQAIASFVAAQGFPQLNVAAMAAIPTPALWIPRMG